ncbi:MAG: response regulator [Rhodospirillaceae bacterium]
MTSFRKRILVVEDEPGTRDMIASYLGNAGFEVLVAEDGGSMTTLLEKEQVDLLVLDLNLPDADGLMLAHELRRKSSMGIVIVSSRDRPTDRADGLEMGADDYVTKPFFPRELLARVRNVLDRTAAARGEAKGTLIRFGPWVMDRDNRHVATEDGRVAQLTSAEFDVLAFLLDHPGRILDREAIAENIGERRSEGGGRKVDILISRLRRKLEDGEETAPRMIETVRGHGYRFAALADYL